LTAQAYADFVAGADELDAAPFEGAEEELAPCGWPYLEPVLGGLLAVAGAAALLLHGGSGSSPSSRAPLLAVAPVLPSPAAVQKLYCPVAEPGGSGCRRIHSVPEPFLAAIRTLLPQVATHYVVSESLRTKSRHHADGLYSRLYEGRDAPAAITVLVQRSADVLADAFDPPVDGNQIVVRARQRVGTFVVDVRISAPAAVAPSRAQVNTLARDPRLVAAP